MSGASSVSGGGGGGGEVFNMHALLKNANPLDLEFVVPSPDAYSRKSSLLTAVFSLVSTVIGGGILSLPFAFMHTGVILGPLMLIFVAICSDFSVYILISCSRRTGATTYESVAAKAFGETAKLATVALIAALTFLCCVAYIVLMRDLFCPLVEYAFAIFLTNTGRISVTVVLLVAILPMCLLRNLNALRFTSLTSIVSILLLAGGVALRCMQRIRGDLIYPLGHLPHPEPWSVESQLHLKFFPASLTDAIYALPIIAVAYLCHFNVLPVHMELLRPTRHRVKRMIHGVVGLVSVLYLLVGVVGYLYALNHTDGNILNNFASNDIFISVGRFGLGMTVLLSFPLLVLPCRMTLQRMYAMYVSAWNREQEETYRPRSVSVLVTKGPEEGRSIQLRGEGSPQSGGPTTPVSSTEGQGKDPLTSFFVGASSRAQPEQSHAPTHSPPHSNEHTPLLHGAPTGIYSTTVQFSTGVSDGKSGDDVAVVTLEDAESPPGSSPIAHFFLTFGIIFVALILTVWVPSVAVVWSLMGSTVSILIAFVLPSAFYLVIRRRKKLNAVKLGAWMLLVGSLVCMVVCSYVAFSSILNSPNAPHVPSSKAPHPVSAHN